MTDEQIRKEIYAIHQRIWDGVIDKIKENSFKSISLGVIKYVAWRDIEDSYPFRLVNNCIGCEFSKNCENCFLKLTQCADESTYFYQLNYALKVGLIDKAVYYAEKIRNCGYHKNRGIIEKMKEFLILC